MASPRPWPFDDDDRPSGSVRPLSPADLQAILAHLGDDPDQLLAGTNADRPVVAVRVRTTVAGLAALPRQGGASNERLSGRPGPGRCPGESPSSSGWVPPAECTAACWRPAEPGPWRAGGHRRRLAARSGGGAAHRPTAQPPGATRVGLPPRPPVAGSVVRGRPGRPGLLGQGRHGGRTGGDGPAPTEHASPAPGGARARTGRRRGQSGPNPLPRCRLHRPQRLLVPARSP
jgi:hypothetical protein